MASKQSTFTVILRYLIITVFLSMLIVGGGTMESMGASEEERVSKLIEGAKLEQKLVIYTTMSIPDSTAMAKRFEKKYPFIKVELYHARYDIINNRIINESKAKRYIADVIEQTGVSPYLLMKERLYASYISPELRAYPEGYKDPAGNWTATYVLVYAMGYNTKLLSRKDIPDTYEGFLNPKWKGKKIGLGPAQVEWFVNMLEIMGEEKGMDFFKKLVTQKLYYSTHGLIPNLLTAGEFLVGTAYAHRMEALKNNGAPVDWVGVSPLITKFGSIGLAANTPHPNAAKLFIDFTLSKEGQMVLADHDRLPARQDIEAEKLKAYKGLKMYPSKLSLADKFTAYSKKFAEILKN